MPKLTDDLVEETIRKEVRELDKSVQVVGVRPDKKKKVFRVILLKDGRSGSADLKEEVIKQSLSQEGRDKKLKRALGKAVSHLSIKYQK
jgi:ABC-type protease/lipase transport system fused ATPase/permease subunit